MGHAGLSQPLRQQLGLSRWHNLVGVPVGEEGRRIAGVDAGNGREETVTFGYGVLGATEKPVHTTKVAQGGETGEVGGQVECCHRSHPGIPEVTSVAAGRWSRTLRIGCKQGQVPAGGAAHEGHALRVQAVAGSVLLDPPYSASDVVGGPTWSTSRRISPGG
jgi:hypothetical protein